MKVLPSGTLFQTPDLEKIASTSRSSKRVVHLARQGGRAERDNLDRRRSTELTVPPSPDARPLVYHSNHAVSRAARFRRAGLLATADTRLFTARRYASAVYAVVVCLSVCWSVSPSVGNKPVLYRNDWTNRTVFGTEASFHVAHPVL